MRRVFAASFLLEGEYVVEGYDADPKNLRDHAEFKNCSLSNEGIRYVIVGGEIAVENSVSAGEKAGHFLQR